MSEIILENWEHTRVQLVSAPIGDATRKRWIWK